MGELSWWGVVHCPTGELPWWGVIRGGSCPGGSCPVGSCPKTDISVPFASAVDVHMWELISPFCSDLLCIFCDQFSNMTVCYLRFMSNEFE